MAQVTIGGNQYDVYADVAFADEYLAADAVRYATWAALTTAGDKERLLVSATRLLQRQTWKAGTPPDVADPPLVVKEATALLAADIALKPTVSDNGSTASNVKVVGAGSARVEFFSPVEGRALPPAAFALLSELLGVPDEDLAGVGVGTAYGSSDCQRSRFDPTDYSLYPYGGEETRW